MHVDRDISPMQIWGRLILASVFLMTGCATNGDMSIGWRCLKKETHRGGGNYHIDLNKDTYDRLSQCIQIESEVAQRRTSEQSERDYRAQNQGKLPEKVSVVYTTKMTPSGGIVKKGGELTLVGHVEVVNGTKEKVHSVEEELVLSYNGEKMQSIVKPMSGSAGVFETKHLVSIPQQFQDGRYTIASRVLINGAVVPTTTRKQKLDVVWIDFNNQLARWTDSAFK